MKKKNRKISIESITILILILILAGFYLFQYVNISDLLMREQKDVKDSIYQDRSGSVIEVQPPESLDGTSEINGEGTGGDSEEALLQLRSMGITPFESCINNAVSDVDKCLETEDSLYCKKLFEAAINECIEL